MYARSWTVASATPAVQHPEDDLCVAALPWDTSTAPAPALVRIAQMAHHPFPPPPSHGGADRRSRRLICVDTLADLGVTRDLSDAEFLAAMERHKQADPAMAAVLAEIKATVKGGVGKLRERPQGKS